MFDEYEIEQPIACRILKNSIKNNKCSHAYLFETNGYSKGLDLAIAFSKYLLCPNSYTNNTKCNNCSQCKIIDDKNYIELKIIEAEGQWIKKEQLLELQEDFNKKAILGNKKIYIINGAEKLNIASSNSILKFLEEPEENIIAILIVDNSKQLLDTIVSRCQLLSLKKNKIKSNDLNTINLIGNYLYNDINRLNEFINNENSIEKINSVIKFVEYYEQNKEDTILYINKLWNDFFSDRNEIKEAFKILLLIYKDAFNWKLNEKLEYFVDNKEAIQNIVNKNSIDVISKKIKIIIDLKSLIKYNINTGLIMDKLIISLKGCE